MIVSIGEVLMLKKNGIKYLLCLMIAVALFGCGGGDDDDSTVTVPQKPSKSIAINAQDAIVFTSIDQTQLIDLRNKVTAEQNQSLVISSVEPLEKDACIVSNINGLLFEVYNSSANVCRLKYDVKPLSSELEGEAKGIVQVVSTNDYLSRNYLPPISRVMEESSVIKFDSGDLLLPAGTVIDSVDLIGNTLTGDIGDVTYDDTSITYQAPDSTTGTVSIYYTAVDRINNIAVPGVIYIGVGQYDNHNPVAVDKSYSDQSVVSIGMLPDGKQFDVSSLVSDIDGDNVQLVSVKSSMGSATISGNTTFQYKGGDVGKENITYIVSDHNGGYGLGSVSFNINTYLSIPDKSQDLIFSPPMTFSEVNSFGGVFTGTFEESGINGFVGRYPVFNIDLADAYCRARGGYLPDDPTLSNMFTGVLGSQPVYSTMYKWHSGEPFLLSGGGTFDLSSGSSSSANVDGYFSCAIPAPSSLSWTFDRPVYPAKLNVATSVLINATLPVSGDKVFLPPDQYQLSVDVESMVVDGVRYTTPIPSDVLSKIDLIVSSNKVMIQDMSSAAEKIDSVVLNVSDPSASNTTKIIYGVTECPNGASFDDSSILGCIFMMRYQLYIPSTSTPEGINRYFTIGMTDNVLRQLIPQSDIDMLPGQKFTKGSVSLHLLNLNGASGSPIDNWRKIVGKACDMLSELKIGSRDNWRSSGYTNGVAPSSGGLVGKVFGNTTLSLDWSKWASQFTGMSSFSDPVQSGYLDNSIVAVYGQNMSSVDPVFLTKYKGSGRDRYVAPTCVSM